MTVISDPSYDFLRTNPHLSGKIIFLTLGGSYAYGTNVEGSDIDVRGCALNSMSDIVGLTNFEQFVKFDNMTVPFSKILEEVLQEEGTLKIKNLSINGTDIIHLGCNEGPMIGKTLAHLLDLVVDGSISNDRESLIKESKDFLGI